MSIKTKAKHLLKRMQKAYTRFCYTSAAKKQLKVLGNVGKLTREQKAEIRDYWQSYGHSVPMLWHRILYFCTGQQIPRFVPETTFLQDILPYMRDEAFVSGWGDKAYLDYFLHDADTVECVLRNVNGRYLNHEFQLVSREEAQKIVDASGPALVVKPTTNTNTGKGVQLLQSPYDLNEIDEKYKRNYVFQLPVRQHTEMAKLNESSVNTLRINTVLFDTEAHVMSAFVKVGQAGQFADNHGHDRFFIGIRPDGTYCDYAINHDMKRFDMIPSGYQFANQPVYHFSEACAAVEQAHRNLAHFGMAFWDVCIREDGKPVIVEVNLRHPNATIAQAAIGGEFFGSYTDEVLHRVMERKRKNH